MAFSDRISDVLKQIGVDIKNLTNRVLPINLGGTGATDVSRARSNLGLGTIATLNKSTKVNRKYYGSYDNNMTISNIYDNTFDGIDTNYQWGNDFSIGGLIQLNYSPDWVGRIFFDIFGHRLLIQRRYSGTIESEWDEVFINHGRMSLNASAVKSGQASYAKGWRKLTTTLPNQAGEVTIAHGVANLETVQGLCTDTDGYQVWQNDPDPSRQFYIRAKDGNLYIGVTTNSTKVFGKTVQLFIGEQL